jgi:hypothetical protein
MAHGVSIEYKKSWVSCEEYNGGQIWQVDPTGIKPSQMTSLGLNDPGNYESFSYDTRNKRFPRFFVTKDENDGELRRL